MTIALAQSPIVKSFGSGSTTTTLSGTFTAGNTLVVLISQWKSASTPSITSITSSVNNLASTNTFTHDDTGTKVTGAGIAGWDSFSFPNVSGNGGSAQTITVTLDSTATFADIILYEISGVLTSSAYDAPVTNQAGTNAGTPTSQAVTGAAALAQGAEIVFSAIGLYNSNNQPSTATAGWTQDTQSPIPASVTGAGGYGTAHRITSAVETPSDTWTFSADSEVTIIVAYKASSPFFPYVTGNVTSGTGAAGAAISPSLSGLTIGNYLVLLVAQNSGTISVPTPAGWTAVPSTANIQNPTGTTDDRAIAAFTKPITATTDGASLTTTGKYQWTMLEVAYTSGPRASSGNTGQVTTAGANPTINSGSGVLTNDLLISYVATMTAASTFTAGTGYTASPTTAPATTNVSTRAETKLATGGGATAAAFVNASTTLWSELAFSMAPFLPQTSRPILQAVKRASYF